MLELDVTCKHQTRSFAHIASLINAETNFNNEWNLLSKIHQQKSLSSD